MNNKPGGGFPNQKFIRRMEDAAANRVEDINISWNQQVFFSQNPFGRENKKFISNCWVIGNSKAYFNVLFLKQLNGQTNRIFGCRKKI